MKSAVVSKLMTMAQVQASYVGKPIAKGPTRLAIADAADKTDAAGLDQWKRSVRHRDRHRCRVCGCKTEVTLALTPKRSECHHIVSRSDKVVRTDIRNGLNTCLTCHSKFKARKLFVVGKPSEMFVASNGKRYLDATCPLTFTPAKPVP